ncbi:MAG: hypothetical protein ACRDD8_15815 [Bacteroidales bacterium]
MNRVNRFIRENMPLIVAGLVLFLNMIPLGMMATKAFGISKYWTILFAAYPVLIGFGLGYACSGNISTSDDSRRRAAIFLLTRR